MKIVLWQPEIHWNTGNIGRTCVATDTPLHLIEPLGFRLDDREIRRAGLDYWPRLKLTVHKSFEAFEATLPSDASLLLFSTKATTDLWDAPYRPDSWLVFGKESAGLPETVRARYPGRLVRIPMEGDVRSLNLSTAAAVALFEGLRRGR